jgi:beta-glucosidase
MTMSTAASFLSGLPGGTSLAAHQSEGNNPASDWWAVETAPSRPLAGPSGDADSPPFCKP